MSKISLKPNASGTANFSIEAPNSNTDRTLNLPDEEGTVATIENIPPGYEDQDALDLFNVTGSPPVYACRAWINCNTKNFTIRGSGNVSSITDISTGNPRINFATNMPDTNYCAVATADDSDGFTKRVAQINDTNFTSASFELDIYNVHVQSNDNELDALFVMASVFR